jgi:hypothetical protein
MAADDRAQNASSVRAAGSPPQGRDRLARMVVVGSFLTLFLLAGALITLARGTNATASSAAEKAFNSILPVLAGWVGTVLAYYFSSASQEHTSEILDRTIGRMGGDPASSVTVSEKMIPSSAIFGLRDLKEQGKAPELIQITDLQKDFDSKLPNGTSVSRLLFVEGGVFKYILHVGALNAYLVKSQQAGNTPGSLKFSDLLKDQDIVNQISKLVVFVSAATTLGDAKAALDKVTGAQDIIVTGTGSGTEPVLGWLSNVDLTKALSTK